MPGRGCRVSKSWPLPALVAGMAVVVLNSCGGGGGTNQPEPPRTPQFVLNPAGASSNAGSFVLAVSAESVAAGRGDVVEVQARVRDRLGLALSGLIITFQASMEDAAFIPPLPTDLEPPQQSFPAGLAITDGSGIARILLRAPGTPGQLAIIGSTALGVGLGGIIFIEVFDSGFIPTPDDALLVIPERIEVTDPVAGLELEMVVLGGVPFSGQTGAEADSATPYQIIGGENSIGTATLVFDGTFPARIRYVLTGRAAGIHSFTVLDANPAGEGTKAEIVAKFTELRISPESASLIAFEREIFAVTGGVPPYLCATTGGSLVPETIVDRGGTTEFTAFRPSAASTTSIVCTDQAGQVATASVSISLTPATPAPTAPAPSPAPTPTAGPPSIVPSTATLQIGQTQVFAISGGTPPYTVNASGGTTTPTTVPAAGGTFTYFATQPDVFTLLVTDSAGKVASATVTNVSAVAIQVDNEGPITISQGASMNITITGGGTPPYTIVLAGGLDGTITGSPLLAAGTFNYAAPLASSSGQILITDTAANARAIAVTVP